MKQISFERLFFSFLIILTQIFRVMNIQVTHNRSFINDKSYQQFVVGKLFDGNKIKSS